MKNNKKSLLIKEIMVLIIFASLITVSVLFLFPVAAENTFFLNAEKNKNVSDFYYGKTPTAVFDETNFESLGRNKEDFSNIKKITTGENYIEILPAEPISCDIGDFIKINLKAKNKESADFPAGSINIQWKYENQSDYDPLSQESVKIFIDGFSHEYIASLGENKNWKPNEKITSLLIELPRVEGVNINVSKISFEKRTIFPLDSFINKFFKENFSIRSINRFLTPAYVGLLFILAMTYSLKLVSRRVLTGKMMFSASVIILFIFSIYFFKNEIITVKSYYDSYKKNILQADLKNTYLGFYDFETFISWADEKIPANENLIVFVRGEQVYIESELAYNLYPRDVKFINISQSTEQKINREISSINSEPKNQNKNSYNYIIALSVEDVKNSDALDLKYSYRPDAGLIYTLK